MKLMNQIDYQVLSQPARFGSLIASNRLIMAPLTRTRANADGTATALMGYYYGERSSAGMIISEGIWPTQQGQAYLNQPGLQTDAQIDAWKPVTSAVTRHGGTFVAQLMHSGRMSHVDISGMEVVGASPVRAPGHAHTLKGSQEYPIPRELTAREIAQIVDDHRAAAVNAMDAGFSGVEIHSANGYLLHQFLSPNTNLRLDNYGGTSRSRFVLEVIEAVIAEVGADRVGIRLSPANNIHGIEEDLGRDGELYLRLAAAIGRLEIAYVSLVHPRPESAFLGEFRSRINAPLLLNTGPSSVTDRDTSASIIAEGHADAVVVGRPYIANPDLPGRWLNGLGENKADESTFYAGGEHGYVDYPTVYHEVASP